MRKLFGAVAILTVPVVLVSNTQAQDGQKRDEGTQSGVKHLITDSPWAKPVTLRVQGDDWEGRDRRLENPGAPETPSASPTRAPTGRADPDSRPNSVARPALIVRWDSAAPVREACAKAGLQPYAFSCYSTIMFASGQADKFDALTRDFYILTVANYPRTVLPRRDQGAPQHSAEANAALERLGDRLKTKTILKRNGKQDIVPEKVLPAAQSLLEVFFFSRSASINTQDRTVAFECSLDPVEIRSRFNLSKMTFDGKLEL
jgi:hypothetical protein